MLWRLLVDRRFQGRGYGGAAVRSVAEYVRGRPGAVRRGWRQMDRAQAAYNGSPLYCREVRSAVVTSVKLARSK
jgi:GNAT superfamily N-acetyltransferase